MGFNVKSLQNTIDYSSLDRIEDLLSKSKGKLTALAQYLSERGMLIEAKGLI